MSCNTCKSIKIKIDKLLKENSNLLLKEFKESKLNEETFKKSISPLIKNALEQETKKTLEQIKTENTMEIKNFNGILSISDKFFKDAVDLYFREAKIDESKLSKDASVDDISSSVALTIKTIYRIFYAYVPTAAYLTAHNIALVSLIKANKSKEAVGLPRAANPTAFREVKIPILFKNKLLKEGMFSKALSSVEIDQIRGKIPTSPEDIRLGKHVDIDDFNRSIDDIKTKKVLPKAVESLNLLIRKISDRVERLKQLGIDLEGIREKRLQEFKAKDKDLYTERQRLDSQIAKDSTTQARIKEIDVERSKLKTELDEFQNNINQRKKYFEEEEEALDKGKKDLERIKEEVEAGKPKKLETTPDKISKIKSVREFINSPIFSFIVGPDLARRNAKLICSFFGDEAVLLNKMSFLYGGLALLIKAGYNKIMQELERYRTAEAIKMGPRAQAYVFARRTSYYINAVAGCYSGFKVDVSTGLSEALTKTGFIDSLDQTTLKVGADAGVSVDEIKNGMVAPTGDLWNQIAIETYVPFYDGDFGKIADTAVDFMSIPSQAADAIYFQLIRAGAFKEVLWISNLFSSQNRFKPTIDIYRAWLNKNGITNLSDQNLFISCFFKNLFGEKIIKIISKAKNNEELKGILQFIADIGDVAKEVAEWFNKEFNKDKMIEFIISKIYNKFMKIIGISVDYKTLDCGDLEKRYGEQMKKFKNLVSKEDLSIRSTDPKETGNFCDDPKNDEKRVPGSEGFVCRKGIAVALPQKPVQPQKPSGRDEEPPEFKF